jgi:hypothetical protein
MDLVLVLEVLAAAWCNGAWHAIRRYAAPHKGHESKRTPA